MKTRRNQKSRNLKSKTRQARASARASASARATANKKRNRRRMHGGFDVSKFYSTATLVDDYKQVVKDFVWIQNRFIRTLDDDIAIRLTLDPKDVLLMYPITIEEKQYLRIICNTRERYYLIRYNLDTLDPYEPDEPYEP